MHRIILILLLISGCYTEEKSKEELKVEARDSYIEAYQDSRQPLQNVDKTDRDLKYPPYFDNSGPEYYGPPQGYPEPSYPPSHYGPPVYGPPAHPPSFPSSMYGVPHAMMGLFDKLKLKLDIYTVLKLILKLVIFKKIVSFIALICLLLFIPKFKLSSEEDDSDSRSFKNNNSGGTARLNTLTEFVSNAIDKYSKANSTSEGINRVTEEIYKNLNR